MLTDDRIEQGAVVRGLVAAWAAETNDIVAAAVVGSWARGAPRTESDLDIVVLTTRVDQYIVDARWIAAATRQEAELVRTQQWGHLVERRVRLSSGLEVEFDFGAPSWAQTDPVDPGTAGVVRDGCEPLFDRVGLLERLIMAVRDAPPAP